VPESVEPFFEWQPPLFLCASELIHAKCDTLGFRALIKILEIHDFSPLDNSSDDGGASDSSGSSGRDDLPGSGGHSLLRPWMAIYRFTDGSSPAGQPWPSLPRHGEDVQWGPQVAWAPHACGLVSETTLVVEQGGKATPPRQPANGRAMRLLPSS
jgi:hypothetical protein